MRVGLNAEPLFQRIPTGVGVYALALCRGLLAGLDSPEWKVRFEPNPARCCVVFETRARCA